MVPRPTYTRLHLLDGYLKVTGILPPPTKTRADRRIPRANRFVARESLLDLAGGSILTPWLKPVAKDTIKAFGWYSMATMALLQWYFEDIGVGPADICSLYNFERSLVSTYIVITRFIPPDLNILH